MRKDLNQWTTDCLQCQRSKVWRHTKTPVLKIPIPSNRFEHIHMDLVGPLPVSRDHRYLLTIIDRFTRWPEVYPLKDICTSTICKAFVDNYLPRFGVPLHITVDQGTQFTSHLFSELTKYLGAHKIYTSPYHPQANGIVERLHRQLKAAIMASDNSNNWIDELPSILLGLRTIVRGDLKCSPAEFVYGEALRIPGEIVVKDNSFSTEDNIINKLRNYFSKVRSNNIHHTKQKSYIPPNLHTCKYVFVRNFFRKGLQTPYQGPFEVVARNAHTFSIRKGNKQVDVAIDNVKPAHMDDTNNDATLLHLNQQNTFYVN